MTSSLFYYFAITLAVFVIGYGLVVLVVYLIQVRLLLNPEQLVEEHEFLFEAKFEELNLFPSKKVRLNCLHFRINEPKGVVLYLHGKSRNMEEWALHFIDFTSKGFDFFTFDYRQFGKSKGPLSEQALFRDALFVYNYLQKEYSTDQIVIYGRSLGSGIATKLATEVKAPHLMLETPYLSLEEMAKKIAWYLPIKMIIKYPIPTFKYLRKRTELTYVFHGTSDEYIPFRHSVRLKLANKKTLKLYPIYGGMHDDLSTFEEYHRVLQKSLDACVS